MRPKSDGILETSLYVSDVPRSVRFYEETLGFRVISEFGEPAARCKQVPARYCCYSRRGLGARSNRRTTAMENYTSRSLSHLPNWPIGSHGSKQEESQWKRNANGKKAAGISTFETRIAI
jgi:catechol 2,3-dioxygenase-like lactoylglutathione lyase family enzyme